MSPRAGLNRDVVVDTAARIIDEPGGELSLGAVAQQLGVRTPSLYNHVDGLDGLRRELALLGMRELGQVILRAAVGRAADDALLEIAHAYRDFARSRPGLYAMIQQAPDPSDAELASAAADIVQVLSAVVAPSGLTGDDAIHAIRGFRSLLHGFVALEAAGGFGLPVALDTSFERAVQTFLRGLGDASAAASNRAM